MCHQGYTISLSRGKRTGKQPQGSTGLLGVLSCARWRDQCERMGPLTKIIQPKTVCSRIDRLLSDQLIEDSRANTRIKGVLPTRTRLPFASIQGLRFTMNRDVCLQIIWTKAHDTVEICAWRSYCFRAQTYDQWIHREPCDGQTVCKVISPHFQGFGVLRVEIRCFRLI